MKNDNTSSREPVGDRVTITKRGKKGVYVADYWWGGQHRRTSLKTTNKKIARKRAIQLEHGLSSGEFSPQPRAVAIKDAIEHYLTHLKTEGRARKTIVRYRGELNSLAEFLATRKATKLSQITTSLVDAFRADRKKDHSDASMYHEGVVAKQFLQWCVSRGLIKQSPLADYRLTKPPRMRRPAPTLTQVNTILARCSPSVVPRANVLAFTGMRVGELQALRKSDVDLRAGFIDVVRQTTGPTKTRAARRIPIHARIRSILKTQLTADSHELLFTAQPSATYPHGGHHINPKRLNEDFKAAVARAGFKGFTLHSLRHFFNTRAIDSGVPEQVVKAWLGHKDRSMTGTYYHLTDENSRSFIERVAFDDVCSKPAADDAA